MTRITDGKMRLYITKADINIMKRRGSWPGKSEKLTRARDCVWSISRDHPDFHMMVYYFGAENFEAVDRCQIAERAYLANYHSWLELYVPIKFKTKWENNGKWPSHSHYLVVDWSNGIWHISPRHPDYFRMRKKFGCQNREMVSLWMQDKKIADDFENFQNNRYRTEMENRKYLKFGSYEEANAVGAEYDRSEKKYFIDCRRFSEDKIKSMVKKYGEEPLLNKEG
jgi:hypothetical protein